MDEQVSMIHIRHEILNMSILLQLHDDPHVQASGFQLTTLIPSILLTNKTTLGSKNPVQFVLLHLIVCERH